MLVMTITRARRRWRARWFGAAGPAKPRQIGVRRTFSPEFRQPARCLDHVPVAKSRDHPSRRRQIYVAGLFDQLKQKKVMRLNFPTKRSWLCRKGRPTGSNGASMARGFTKTNSKGAAGRTRFYLASCKWRRRAHWLSFRRKSSCSRSNRATVAAKDTAAKSNQSKVPPAPSKP